MSDLFNVYYWDANGLQHTELDRASPEDAVRAAKRLSTGPAGEHGLVTRVIITDSDDFCCFEWRDGRVVYDGKDVL